MKYNNDLPLIPIVLPWKNSKGNSINLLQAYLSRFFTYNFLIIIWIIWYFLVEMSSTECITPNQKVGCSAAIWHENIKQPILYFISFFSSPFFYNSSQHIRFTTITFLIFVQSFEAKVGTKNTILVFFCTIISIGLLGGLVSNIGFYLFPESSIFSNMLERNWMGASSGFMGIIGSMGHHSKFKLALPGGVILFESWNYFINGISLTISITHIISCFFGYIFWRQILILIMNKRR